MIIQLEEKVESQKQNETINQLAADVKKAEHDRLAKHFREEIQNVTALKIDNLELNRKIKKLGDALEDKEERNKQLIAKQSAQLIKSVADKVANKRKCSKLKQKVSQLKNQQN